MQAAYFSKGRVPPCVTKTSDHASKPGVSLSTMRPSKSNISAAVRLVESKRFLYLGVRHRPHPARIQAPLVHVLHGLHDDRTRALEQRLDRRIRVGFRHTGLE